VSEQRQRFLEDYQLNYYSITELDARFSIPRATAHPIAVEAEDARPAHPLIDL